MPNIAVVVRSDRGAVNKKKKCFLFQWREKRNAQRRGKKAFAVAPRERPETEKGTMHTLEVNVAQGKWVGERDVWSCSHTFTLQLMTSISSFCTADF